MIVSGTGHRPDKLGGYGKVVLDRLTTLAVDALKSLNPESVVTGMAQGWDTALALACCELQIPFHAYIPFRGQELKWPSDAQRQYRELVDEWADKVVICSPGDYAAWKMQYRNERVVRRCDALLALWDGSSGGTANCIAYARNEERDVINVWSYWHRHYGHTAQV